MAHANHDQNQLNQVNSCLTQSSTSLKDIKFRNIQSASRVRKNGSRARGSEGNTDEIRDLIAFRRFLQSWGILFRSTSHSSKNNQQILENQQNKSVKMIRNKYNGAKRKIKQNKAPPRRPNAMSMGRFWSSDGSYIVFWWGKREIGELDEEQTRRKGEPWLVFQFNA